MLYSSKKEKVIAGAVLLKRNETPKVQNENEESENQNNGKEDTEIIDPLEDDEVAVAVHVSDPDFQFKRGDVVGFLVPVSELEARHMKWEEDDKLLMAPPIAE